MPTILAPPFVAGTPSSGSVRFLLNGQMKTVDIPVTGNALHSIAGYPKTLTSNGAAVPNDYATYYLVQDQVLVATY